MFMTNGIDVSLRYTSKSSIEVSKNIKTHNALPEILMLQLGYLLFYKVAYIFMMHIHFEHHSFHLSFQGSFLETSDFLK